MYMYQLEVYVVDFENYGVRDYITEIEQLSMGSFQVKSAKIANIGEWSDDHEVNQKTTSLEAFRKYFSTNETS